MRRALLLIVLSLLIGGNETLIRAQSGLDQRVGDLTSQIASKMSASQKKTIAVVEFADLQGRVTDFGLFLSEELITRLFSTEKFKVIERHILNKVIAEQKLSLTGVVDPASAKRLGRVLGVDAIVSGTITELSQGLRVNARLISTETGELFAVASTEIFKDESVVRLMEKGGSGPASPTSDSPTRSDKNSVQKVTAKFLTFELQQCRMTGSVVTCDLLVTNNEQDREIFLGEKSKMFDEFGNDCQFTRVRVANREDRFVTAGLVSGVATKVRFIFDGASPQAKKISLLDVVCDFRGGERFRAQFRNVELIK